MTSNVHCISAATSAHPEASRSCSLLRVCVCSRVRVEGKPSLRTYTSGLFSVTVAASIHLLCRKRRSAATTRPQPTPHASSRLGGRERVKPTPWTREEAGSGVRAAPTWRRRWRRVTPANFRSLQSVSLQARLGGGGGGALRFETRATLPLSIRETVCV